MLIELPYNREKAVAYARAWALKRNPRYLDFEKMGGDCTNFASQCLFAGSGVMNHTPTLGWYYNSGSDRSPSWTGVPYLRNFLVANKGPGPYATETDEAHALPGDIVQLGDETGRFYHSPVVCETGESGILVCAHTFDADLRPLYSYSYAQSRVLHIEGGRNYQ